MKKSILAIASIAVLLASATQCSKSPEAAYTFSTWVETIGGFIYQNLSLVAPFVTGVLLATFRDFLKFSALFKSKTNHEHH
ncbi:hypothetical protein [Phaeocystidibacter marisrubri]|uniref:Uncharacterized protein n=1 Tax=Phaeocystidibacter marisrubri TaxID=1577780 RepID=A0A6L3ZBI6_9FLAO|nr:hypothetical protein [Phaeocystidibacter marisrubri]KAB2814948.1 hypothetical protein F8C82_14700 [Phaeocystidibacter marisrubri]